MKKVVLYQSESLSKAPPAGFMKVKARSSWSTAPLGTLLMNSHSLVFPFLLFMTQKTPTRLCGEIEPIRDKFILTSCSLIECRCATPCFYSLSPLQLNE